jgi:hypothetical protein
LGSPAAESDPAALMVATQYSLLPPTLPAHCALREYQSGAQFLLREFGIGARQELHPTLEFIRRNFLFSFGG